MSVICALVTNRVDALSSAIMNGTTESVNFIIALAGIMIFWTGLMKIAESSGLTESLSEFFSPIFKLLFKDLYSKQNKKNPAIKAISLNVTANLLGLGNAATPFGIKAISEMQKFNSEPKCASNSMIMFIVLNSASLQLIPTTILFLRQKYGSKNPMEILPIMWLTSLLSLVLGIIFTKIFEKVKIRTLKQKSSAQIKLNHRQICKS